MQHTLKSQIVIDQNHRIICANTTHEKEHNFSLLGAKYTRGRRPARLVYSLKKKNKSAAAKEEGRIKKLSRADKISLVGSN